METRQQPDTISEIDPHERFTARLGWDTEQL